jgi:hypothetical protein
MLEPVDLLSRGFRLSSLGGGGGIFGANCCIARKAVYDQFFFAQLNASERIRSVRFICTKCCVCHPMCVRHKAVAQNTAK